MHVVDRRGREPFPSIEEKEARERRRRARRRFDEGLAEYLRRLEDEAELEDLELIDPEEEN